MEFIVLLSRGVEHAENSSCSWIRIFHAVQTPFPSPSTCGVRVSQRDGSVKGESPTSLQMLLFCLEYLQNERVAAIIPNKACKVKQTNGIWKDPLGVNKCHS